MKKFSNTKFIIKSLACIILSYYISVLSHEYAHATMAWILGYKSSPFDIIYGSWYLMPISENVNYAKIFASSHPVHGGLIAMSGIGMTLILFLISFFILKKEKHNHFYKTIFFFYLGATNLMELFSYIPNRVFITGDVTEIATGFHLSLFWFLIIGTPLVCYAIYAFYKHALGKIYGLLSQQSSGLKRFVLYLSFWPICSALIYGGAPMSYSLFSYGMNVLSVLVLILVAYRFDPHF